VGHALQTCGRAKLMEFAPAPRLLIQGQRGWRHEEFHLPTNSVAKSGNALHDPDFGAPGFATYKRRLRLIFDRFD